MTNADRDRLRRKQDTLIDLALHRGTDLALRVAAHEKAPTLRQLETMVWPEWEQSIDRCIKQLA